MKFKNFELMAILTIWEPFEDGGETIKEKYICETWEKAKELGELITEKEDKKRNIVSYTIDDHFESIEEMILYYND